MPTFKKKPTPISNTLLRCHLKGGGVVYGMWVLFKPSLRRGQFWEKTGTGPDDYEPRHERWCEIERWEYADPELQEWDQKRKRAR